MQAVKPSGVMENAAEVASAYQVLLGAAFAELPPLLRQVHGSAPRVQARGWMRVRHGRGWLVRLVNAASGVPRAAERVPLHLEIRRSGEEEQWLRTFGEKLLQSRQWAANGLFQEQSGPVRLAMRLWVEEGALCFASQRSWMLGLPLPRWAGLQVNARATAHADGKSWEVWVESRSGMLGMLFEYTGNIELEA